MKKGKIRNVKGDLRTKYSKLLKYLDIKPILSDYKKSEIYKRIANRTFSPSFSKVVPAFWAFF